MYDRLKNQQNEEDGDQKEERAEEQFEEEIIDEGEAEEDVEPLVTEPHHSAAKAATVLQPVVDAEDATNNIYKSAVATFLYKPLVPLPNLAPYLQGIIEIRVASEYMCKSNKAYRIRNFWGSDIYTSDSDVVCIMQHFGMFEIKEYPSNNMAGVAVYFRVTKGRNSYSSTLRNRIRSRKLGPFEVSYAA